MTGSEVLEHPGRIAKVAIELTILRAVLRTVRHGVVNCIAPYDMTLICSDDGVLI